MGKKNTIDLQTGVNLLLGVVILGCLGWLLSEVNNLGKTTIETQQIAIQNKDRMNRIGENLPQIKSVIASIEIEDNLDNALIAYEPEEQSDGTWIRMFKLAELPKRQITTYSVSMKNREDDLIMMASTGTILNCDVKPTISFFAYESVTNANINIPNVDKKNSWVMTCSAENVDNLLKSNSLKTTSEAFSLNTNDITTLIDSLKVDKKHKN